MARSSSDFEGWPEYLGTASAALRDLAVTTASGAALTADDGFLAFNDVSLLTAIGNDVSFDEIFALPLGRLARAGDLVIAISSSGNSPNVIRALEKARSIAMQIVTLTGKGADNRARARGDLNFYVPADRYGWVECAHQLILHYWLDQYLNLHGGGAL